MRRLLLLLLLASCSGRPAHTADAGHVDTDAGVDAGPHFTPASHPALPQVLKQSGPVLASPELVPIFFTNDDATTPGTVMEFLRKLVASRYWHETLDEYGIGAGTVRDAVTAGMAAAIDDADLETWFTDRINDHSLPTPGPNTLYLLHYPTGVRVTEGGGTACEDWDAYHSEFQLGQQYVAYAVLPRCPAGTSGLPTAIDVLTTSASHEILEAITDPYPDWDPAYTQVEDAHLFWDDVNSGSEVADMCQYDDQAYVPQEDIGFQVQRSWSNVAAAANHDPCVPHLEGEVYFNAIPELPDQVDYSYGHQRVRVPAVSIPVGQSRTITLDLYSDDETEPWTILAQDYGAWSCTMGAVDPGCDTTMEFAYRATTGRNGDRIQLTITPKAAGSTGARGNLDYFIVTSTNAAGEQHFSVGVVAE